MAHGLICVFVGQAGVEAADGQGGQAQGLDQLLGQRFGVLAAQALAVEQAAHHHLLRLGVQEAQHRDDGAGGGILLFGDQVFYKIQRGGVVLGVQAGPEGEHKAQGAGRAAGLAEIVDHGLPVIRR